jgi:hypothetical protein
MADPRNTETLTFFAYDAIDGEYQEFATQEEALAWAAEAIGLGEEGWIEEVSGITVGQITHRATFVNVRPPGKDDSDEFEFLAECEMRPLASSDQVVQIPLPEDGVTAQGVAGNFEVGRG